MVQERGKRKEERKLLMDGNRNSELHLRSEEGLSLHRQVWAEIKEVLVNAAREVGSIIAGRF